MRFTALLLFSSLLVLQSLAQGSCEDSVILRKGSWKKHEDANMRTRETLSSSQLLEITTRIDKIQQVLLNAYPRPVGIEAEWYRSMSYSPLIPNGPVPYELNALFLKYYCNPNYHKMMAGTETGTWFNVWVNQLHDIGRKNEKFLVEKAPVYLLARNSGMVNGFPAYGGTDIRSSNTGTTFSETILITRTGQSLFIPVTKKQYLETFLANKETAKKEMEKELEKIPVLTDAEEQVIKAKMLAQIEKQTGTNPKDLEKARERFQKNYISSQQRREEQIKNNNRVYQDQIKPARDLLVSANADELAKPVFFSDYGYDYYFKQFNAEGDGMQMMLLNPAYLNPALPKIFPQFLIAYCRWEKNTVSQNFRDQVAAHIEYSRLKEMIDK